jgi:polyphosphate glucokinase
MMPVVDRPTVASRPRTLVVMLEPPELTATLLDPAGAIVAGPARSALPEGAEPEDVLKLLWPLVETLDEYDRTTFVLDTEATPAGAWDQKLLEAQSMRPVRVVRATELVSRPALTSLGTEMVLTLGPRFEAALFSDGRQLVGFDLCAHPFRKKATYSDYLGGHAFAKQGRKKWNKRVHRAIAVVLEVFQPRQLYLTGRYASTVHGELAANISVIPDRTLEAALAVWA